MENLVTEDSQAKEQLDSKVEEVVNQIEVFNY